MGFKKGPGILFMHAHDISLKHPKFMYSESRKSVAKTLTSFFPVS